MKPDKKLTISFYQYMNADVKRNDIPLKSPIKMQLEMQKRINLFLKFPRFWGHF